MGKKNRKNHNKNATNSRLEKDDRGGIKTDGGKDEIFLDEDLYVPDSDANADKADEKGGENSASTDLQPDSTDRRSGSTGGRPAGKEKNSNGGVTNSYIARLIVVLCLICALVSGLLASVNAVTKDKISEHTELAKRKAVLEAFPRGTDCEAYKQDGMENEVYIVYYENDIIGRCVYVSPQGFGGSIDMMVGIDSLDRTVGVSIVSMSETPGVGTKVKNSDFLNRFIGKDGNVNIGGGVDGVSGATISSKAVAFGVRSAHSVVVDLEKIASEKGVRVLNVDEINAPVETETDVPETTAPPATEGEGEEPVPADTSAPETDVPFIEAFRRNIYNYAILAEETDRFYRVEINKQLYSELLEKEDDTTEEETEKQTEPKKNPPEPKKTTTAAKPKEPDPKPVTTAPEENKSPQTEPVDPATTADTSEPEINPESEPPAL